MDKKFCKFCGQQIDADSIHCAHCGRQIEQTQDANQIPQPAATNNVATSNNGAVAPQQAFQVPVDKWIAFLLCLTGGWFGAHKFYEGRSGMGVLYMLTFGLLCIGWILDCFIILSKPNPYYTTERL